MFIGLLIGFFGPVGFWLYRKCQELEAIEEEMRMDAEREAFAESFTHDTSMHFTQEAN